MIKFTISNKLNFWDNRQVNNLKSLDYGQLSSLFHGLTKVISYNILLSALLLNTIAPGPTNILLYEYESISLLFFITFKF